MQATTATDTDKAAIDEPLYSIATWDADLQSYSEQQGLTVPSFNITLRQLRVAMRELRALGYSVHRYRDEDGQHRDNDPSVLIERTDGRRLNEIQAGWAR